MSCGNAITLGETPSVHRLYFALQRELRHAIAQMSTICVASSMSHRIRAKRTDSVFVLTCKLHTCESLVHTYIHPNRRYPGNFPLFPSTFMETFSLFTRMQQVSKSMAGTPELKLESFRRQNNHKKARNGATRNETDS